MKLKSILVDASALQRRAVARLIGNTPHLVLVGEYGNPLEAKSTIEQHEVDLMFLDVEMPIISGFEFLEVLENPPQVILITGKPDYAYKAFDYNVTDYLCKPIAAARFNTAVQRAIARCGQALHVMEAGAYIFVKSNFKQRKVFLNEIKWVEALGDYIKVVTYTTNLVVLSTMRAFEQQLPAGKFMRIHKSYIVNLDKIDSFSTKNVDIDGQQLPLSRNKKMALAVALNSV